MSSSEIDHLKSIEDPQEKADLLLNQAFEAQSFEEHWEFLNAALEWNPEQIDAQLALLGLADYTPRTRVKHLRNILATAEKQLGPDVFENARGHFWGIWETRPYMRARAQLAETYREIPNYSRAIAEYREMLKLNPGDNQGIRYLLLPLLLQMKYLEEAAELMSDYPDEDEYSAVFAWGSPLFLLLTQMAPDLINAAIDKAREVNPLVEKYITTRRKVPKNMPPHYAMGSEEEAVIFGNALRQAWQKHPKAIAYLKAYKT